MLLMQQSCGAEAVAAAMVVSLGGRPRAAAVTACGSAPPHHWLPGQLDGTGFAVHRCQGPSLLRCSGGLGGGSAGLKGQWQASEVWMKAVCVCLCLCVGLGE